VIDGDRVAFCAAEFAAAAAPTVRRAAAGAKAAVIDGDRVAFCAAEFAAAAAPTVRRAAATSSRVAATSSVGRRHLPGRGDIVSGAAASSVGRRRLLRRGDILPSRVGSCRSAGRRESGGDPWRSRRSLRGRIRGCRRSYIAPGGGDIVPGAAASSVARRLRPWGGDIVPCAATSSRAASVHGAPAGAKAAAILGDRVAACAAEFAAAAAPTLRRAAATSSRERRLRPWGGDIVPGRVGLCGARTAPHLRSIPL